MAWGEGTFAGVILRGSGLEGECVGFPMRVYSLRDSSRIIGHQMQLGGMKPGSAEIWRQFLAQEVGRLISGVLVAWLSVSMK